MTLPTKAEIIAAIERRSQKIGFTKLHPARLGNGNGKITVPDAIPADTWVYYHVEDPSASNGVRVGIAQLTASSGIIYSDDSTYHGLPIVVGLPPTGFGYPGEAVMGLGNLDGQTTGGGTNIYNTIINNYINPDAEQILLLKLQALETPGLGVTVRGPYFYMNRNSRQRELFTTSDDNLLLASAVGALTADQHQIAIVYLDLATGLVGIALGPVATSADPLPNREAFTIDDVNAIPVNFRAVAPSGVVYLYYGQTEITDADFYPSFEVRPIGQVAAPKNDAITAGVYRNPILAVDEGGVLIGVSEGIDPSPAVDKTVTFEMSADDTVTGGATLNTNPHNLAFDTPVVNDDSAGLWDSGNSKFVFTAPADAVYRVELYLPYDGTFIPNAQFWVTVYGVTVNDTIIHIRQSDWSSLAAFTGHIYLDLTAGAVVTIRGRIIPTGANVLIRAGAYATITWKNPATSGLRVREADLSPDVYNVGEIRVSNGKLTDIGGGVVALDLNGTPLTVAEADGTPSVTNVNKIVFDNGTVTDSGSGEVRVTNSGGGGGGGGSVTVEDIPNDVTGAASTLRFPSATLTDDGSGQFTYRENDRINNPPDAPSAYNDEFNGSSLDAKWTVYNGHSNSVITVENGCLVVRVTQYGSATDPGTYRGIYQSLPSAPYDVQVKYFFDGLDTSDRAVLLLALQETSSGKRVAVELANAFYWCHINGSLGSDAYGSLSYPVDAIREFYFRIKDDGTYRTFYISLNGITWYQMNQEASGSYCVPDRLYLYWITDWAYSRRNYTFAVDWVRVS